MGRAPARPSLPSRLRRRWAIPAFAPVVVPWLQLNSLGLTILLHPNSDDPRADHLHYTLWVNRSQPVNGYAIPARGAPNAPAIEKILPNITPTVPLET